ncbi:hypothetical protein JYU14_03335 [Simkania negevensis]|uniref:Lipoprotein n=1 Tax=Simkania negevensis TaxID=83561 RepID=A0ABS3AQT1_9BACT|nr:hypothetical protein [Simkania negevensis]
MASRFLFLLLLNIGLVGALTSCHYSFQSTENNQALLHSLSLPYATGDKDGKLTDALAEALTHQGWSPPTGQGRRTLQVTVINIRSENIGFRFERDGSDRVTNSLIPDEARLFATVDYTLVEEAKQRLVIGPFRITATSDFSYQADTSIENSLNFSVGQLSTYTTAKNNAHASLYNNIAQQIASQLKYYW